MVSVTVSHSMILTWYGGREDVEGRGAGSGGTGLSRPVSMSDGCVYGCVGENNWIVTS